MLLQLGTKLLTGGLITNSALRLWAFGAQRRKAWIQSVLLLHNERRAAHWTPPLATVQAIPGLRDHQPLCFVWPCKVWSQECYEHARREPQSRSCESREACLVSYFWRMQAQACEAADRRLSLSQSSPCDQKGARGQGDKPECSRGRKISWKA